MPLRLIPLLLTLLLVAACDSSLYPREDFDQLTQDPAALVGTWEWACDGSFWSGGRCDPSSVSETETLVFGADGSLVVVRNGEVAVETTYEVRQRIPEAPGDPILDAGLFGDYVFGVDERRLVLFVDGLADGPERLFFRGDGS